jgi:uncharacterized small protein (DUF1192 family)
MVKTLSIIKCVVCNKGCEAMAIDTDDADLPKSQSRRLAQPMLEPMGVGELQNYIAELKAEIGRAQAAINAKTNHRNTADAFFRK